MQVFPEMRGNLIRFIDLVLGLLLLLPLFYITLPTWQEYVQLFFLTIILGYLWWRYRGDEETGRGKVAANFLALLFIFLVTQFNPATGDGTTLGSVDGLNGSFLASGGLILIVFGAFALSREAGQGELELLDRVVVAIALLGIGIIGGARLAFGGELPWIGAIKLASYVILWFVITRSISTRVASRNRLAGGMLVVFSVVFLGGCIRVGTTFYHFKSGEKTKIENAEVALEHFQRARELSQALGFENLRDASLFEQAEILFKQGEKDRAAKILSMEEGFSHSIQSQEWEGPAGGILYKNISCWKDLILFQGKVEIQIFAWGQPALDIWPQMQVKLGDEVLGEVDVTSFEAEPYTFRAGVRSGRHRLEISFLNDYHASDLSSDRNLWVEQTSISYQKINWN